MKAILLLLAGCVLPLCLAETLPSAPATTPRTLDWAQHDNGTEIRWIEANHYCQQQGPGWRLPSTAELMQLFDPTESTRCGWNYCHVAPIVKLSGNWFWSHQSRTAGWALGVNLDLGRIDESRTETESFGRALCVRER